MIRFGARTLTTLTAMALTAYLLSACSFQPNRGVASEIATKRVQAIDGIAEAHISVPGHYEGFHRKIAVYVMVTIAENYAVTDPKQFIDYLATLAWSVNDKRPNDGIAIAIEQATGETIPWDEVAVKAGWAADVSQFSDFAEIDLQLTESKLGKWPGTDPPTPTGMLSPIAAQPDESGPPDASVEDVQAVIEAMRTAGVEDSPVMLAGCLGGITAAAIACGDSGFNIQQVVTAGAPIGRMPIPAPIAVIALEAEHDVVARLDGARNPDRPNWITVRERGSLLPHQSEDSLLDRASAHDANRYALIARDNAAVKGSPALSPFFEGTGTVTDFYASRARR